MRNYFLFFTNIWKSSVRINPCQFCIKLAHLYEKAWQILVGNVGCLLRGNSFATIISRMAEKPAGGENNCENGFIRGGAGTSCLVAG